MSTTTDSGIDDEIIAMRKQAAENAAPDLNTPSLDIDDADAEKAQSTVAEEPSALQQSIENSLAEDRVRLPIGGERIRFRTFNGPCDGHPDSGGEISDRVALNDERLDRMNADDFESQYNEEVAWMCLTLGWAAEPEFMNAEWWEDMFSIIRIKEYLNMIQLEREFSEDQIKKLRRRGRV